MQTFLFSPGIAQKKPLADVERVIRESATASREVFMEHVTGALRPLLDFDHFIYMEPVVSETRIYRIWPPYKGTMDLLLQKSSEQDAIVLNSYHDTLVRICGRYDIDTITGSVLKKYISEANGESSLIFLRHVLRGRFIGQYGFLSFKSCAYGEKEASLLFGLLEVFKELWERIPLKSPDPYLQPLDPNFFSLINLPGMQNVLKKVYAISREDFPVLLLGETGTGKEGVAGLIYRSSARRGRPFIKINCGGIPLSLMESKLFGYVKGAFTGAAKDTPGCFEMADGGALLLDEIGELPLGAQADLLRVLQERVLERVGSSVEIRVNVRTIAATNRNLVEMADKRRFRSDLLYRLSVFPIYIPALRERPEDIPVLLNFFVLQQAKRRGFAIPPRIQPSEMRQLCAYGWPGNIREMQNAVIRAMLMWNGAKESAFTIDVGRRLFAGMFASPQNQAVPLQAAQSPGAPPVVDSLRLEDIERAHIRRVLDLTHGKVTGKGGAAELMDINPSTLRARMKKLGILR